MPDSILLAAGGTGGHLFPAEALAAELGRRGWGVELATDHRATNYGRDFPARAVHVVASASPRGGGLVGKAGAAWTLARGIWESRRIIRGLRPRAVVGFGGYPVVPPVLAAGLARVPTVLHEQNAVMGKANRFLAGRVTAIATSFADVRGLDAGRAKVTETGNPVRDRVLAAAARAYAPPAEGEPVRLLVFGGSQGASAFSALVPAAVAALPAALRERLAIVMQAREPESARVAEALTALGVRAEVAGFYADLPQRMANAHLVMGRAGASTCAELTVIGRPAILVPLPQALDDDQKYNARRLEAAGAAVMAEQGSLTGDRLAGLIAGLAGDPARLAAMAAAAKRIGRPDAVARLADVVEKAATGVINGQVVGGR